MSSEEALLARRVMTGSEGEARDAEAELYRRLAPRARLFGLRHLRDRAAADDLAQEALLITFEKLRKQEIREPEQIGSFVLGTCRMLATNQKRGDSRRRALIAEAGSPFDSIVEPNLLGLDAGRLADCMGRLPERGRAVMMSTFYADRSAQEIGAELHISPANVRVIRHRTLTQLQECMGAE